MELVLKTSGQKCLVGSNPTPSARDTRPVGPHARTVTVCTRRPHD